MLQERELTESERLELRELRIKTQTAAQRLQALEVDKMDVEMEIRELDKWKKGRGIGFILAILAFIIATMIFLSLADIQFDAGLGKSQYVASVFAFSVSTTSILFAGLFVLVFMVIALILGIRLLLEMGKSQSLRNAARRNFQKNYYNVMEECRIRENEILTEIINLRRQTADWKKRLEELELYEIPWNQ